MIDKGKYLSVGQISECCEVDVVTVEGWIARGLMGPKNSKAKNKQVLLEDFISFLNKNNQRPREGLNTEGPKVLVVDDELSVADVIGGIFSTLVFSVSTTTDAIMAGCLINAERPQIVTLDLGLNSFDGLDVLKIISGLKLQGKVWVVVISGGSVTAMQEALDLGADCYLQKPFSHDDLEKIINKFFPGQIKNTTLKAS